jgi:cell wall-associated NlpC family hydrolase
MSSKRSKRFAGAAALVFAVAALGAAMLLVFKPFAGPGQAAGDRAAAQPKVPIAATFDGSDYFDRADTATQPAANVQRDPEEKYASPEAAGAKPHRVADMPAASTTKRPAVGGTSAELRKELKDGGGDGDHVTLASDGSAVPPIGAPDAVLGVITAANAIRSYPYIWGGGHGSFQDRGYDCSGSVSYALAGGGLLSKPMSSGRFESWGEPGKGKWITIYANGGHMFMIVGGLRFDTSFRDGPRGSRWQDAERPMKGFTVRHWPGL